MCVCVCVCVCVCFKSTVIVRKPSSREFLSLQSFKKPGDLNDQKEKEENIEGLLGSVANSFFG